MDKATVWAIIIFAGQIVIVTIFIFIEIIKINMKDKKQEKLFKEPHKPQAMKSETEINLLKDGEVREANEALVRLQLTREKNKQKIGEILVAYKYITKEVLGKALEYQKQYGCSITQYLLTFGYIDESRLAQCLCTQFGVPYLPLASCDIEDEIIKLVPADIAEKYWLIPVEKVGNMLVVVMADPIDIKALKALEEITGCTVQPFVGILSQIMEALEIYYKIKIKNKNMVPYFVDTPSYKGLERRGATRFKARIDVQFPVEGYYKKSKTKDVSRAGLLLESKSVLPVNSLVTLQIDLPKEANPLPIPALVQVMRVNILDNKNFEIGVKLISISRQDIDNIIKFACTHTE